MDIKQDLELEPKVYPVCKRCGRRLKTEEAILRGMGKICWMKSQTSEEKKSLFSQEMNKNGKTE